MEVKDDDDNYFFYFDALLCLLPTVRVLLYCVGMQLLSFAKAPLFVLYSSALNLALSANFYLRRASICAFASASCERKLSIYCL